MLVNNIAVETGVVMVVYLHEALKRKLAAGQVVNADDCGGSPCQVDRFLPRLAQWHRKCRVSERRDREQTVSRP